MNKDESKYIAPLLMRYGNEEVEDLKKFVERVLRKRNVTGLNVQLLYYAFKLSRHSEVNDLLRKAGGKKRVFISLLNDFLKFPELPFKQHLEQISITKYWPSSDKRMDIVRYTVIVLFDETKQTEIFYFEDDENDLYMFNA